MFCYPFTQYSFVYRYIVIHTNSTLGLCCLTVQDLLPVYANLKTSGGGALSQDLTKATFTR